MGKRRRNERAVLPGNIGFSKVRVCPEHQLITNPVKIFGRGMQFHCKEGCKLDKTQTNLVVPQAPSKRR
jgi:hypothetical protein